MENETETSEQNDSVFDSQGWKEAKEACEELSEEAGSITQGIYSVGGLPGIAAGEVVGDFVEENFEHVCALPQNIHDSITGEYKSVEDVEQTDAGGMIVDGPIDMSGDQNM